jgi:hypothetical protein
MLPTFTSACSAIRKRNRLESNTVPVPNAHRDVGGGQVEPALPRMLLGTGGDNDDLRIGGDRDVVGSFYGAVRHELTAVVEVEHLRTHLLGIDVVERQRPRQTRGSSTRKR